MSKKLQDAFLKYQQTGDEKDLLACVQTYKETWLRDRQQTQEKKWIEQRAFYSGNHYVRIQEQQGTNGYRVRLRENHVNNTVQRIQSIFVQNMPIVRAFPASDSYHDIDNAKTTEMYAKSYSRQNKLDTRMGEFVKYGCIYGNAFTYSYFDYSVKGQLTLDPDESPSGDMEDRKYQGDVKVKIESPMMYLFRPGIYSLDDHYDYIRMESVAKADLESQYGEISADPVKIYNSMTGVSRVDEDAVMKNDYYHMPTPWFEEGLYVCWAGKKILKAGPYPFDFKPARLNISHFAFDTVPDQFWGMASIEQIMDMQEQLNKAASMIVEARNLIARPRVMVSHEAQVPAQSFSDRPGDIVRYKMAGGAPQFYVPNFNFAELSAHKSDLRNAMGFVSGLSSASRGDIPAATKTALALQLVLEQDRSQFLPTIKRFHQCVHDTYFNVLSIAAQYISEDDPRIVKIEGQTGATTMFHGGMVPSPLDVYLEDTNPLGWTAAGRAEQIQNLVSAGLVTDQNKALEMLQLNLTDPAYDVQKINRQAAQKEIESMNKGNLEQIGPADMDSVHLEEHDKYIASYSFKSLPAPVQEAHLQHREQHIQRMAQAQAPQAPQGQVQDIQGNLSAPLQAPVPPGIEALGKGGEEAA